MSYERIACYEQKPSIRNKVSNPEYLLQVETDKIIDKLTDKQYKRKPAENDITAQVAVILADSYKPTYHKIKEYFQNKIAEDNDFKNEYMQLAQKWDKAEKENNKYYIASEIAWQIQENQIDKKEAAKTVIENLEKTYVVTNQNDNTKPMGIYKKTKELPWNIS